MANTKQLDENLSDEPSVTGHEGETSQDPHVRAAHAAYRKYNAPQDAPPETPTCTDEAGPAEATIIEEFLPEDNLTLEPLTGDNTETQRIIESLEAEKVALKEQLIRTMADADNFRKRAEREKEDLGKYAVSGFARDLVEVLESLSKASQSISTEEREANPGSKALAEGIELTLQQLLKIFEKQGIKRIDPLGEKFDHNFHQAVAQVESAEHAPGTVLQVIQAGYVIHDRLLRPAMVAVTKAPAASA